MSIEAKLNEYRSVVGFVCPAEFWPALGYEGEARYVAIWWTPAGDEASWSDGRSMVVGASWAAYLELMAANFPLGHSERWLLGSSEDEATMRLVVDRMTEWAWLVPVDEAEDVLRQQWPMEDVAAADLGVERQESVLTFEELMGAIERLTAERPMAVDLAEVERRMAEEGERFEAFRQALGRRVAPGRVVSEGE